MSPRVRRISFHVAALTAALSVLSCGEQSPTRPLLESGTMSAQGPATQAALEAQINGLINALYEPNEQGAIERQFAQIKAKVASRRTDEAEAGIVAFVQVLLGDLADGDLEDPNGTQPPTTADALASLVNAVAQFGGLPAPIPPSNPLGGDGAVAVVGPAGGTVVTSTGFGGVQFPPGALPENTIVVVERLPNPTQSNTGPLPTTFNQYPLFYDFSTTPHVAQFAQPVLVGICQLEVGQPFGPPSQTVADRLQIAHPHPANPAFVELLAREPAPFVDCAGVQLAELRQRRQGEGMLARALGAMRDLRTSAAALFRPTPAYAVHGGLGGKTTSFSPFGAVDPGTQLAVQLFSFANGTNSDVGGSAGVALGGATRSGGRLVLNGSSGYVELNQKIIPGTSFSVGLFARELVMQPGWVEFISQGVSGTGFYIGRDPAGNIRVSDAWLNTGIPMPADQLEHHYAVTYDAGTTTIRLYVDGTLRATLSASIAAGLVGGNNTRFGRQFNPFAEYLNGTLDDVAVINGVWSGPEVQSIASRASTHACNAEGTLFSGIGPPAAVVFENQAAEPVKVEWLDYFGQRVLYHPGLQPGTAYAQGTFVTHPWIITGVNTNTCYGIWLPVAGGRIVRIG